jgi:predicted metal-binding transcription factor (methanogenesis marker protein 9)
MTKTIPLLVGCAFLLLAQIAFAQEKFIDVRQEMADNLDIVKDSVGLTAGTDWAEAQKDLKSAKKFLTKKVKSMLEEGVEREIEATVKGDTVRKALEEADGDVEQAIEILRKKGVGKFKKYLDQMAEVQNSTDLSQVLGYIEQVAKEASEAGFQRAKDIWNTEVKPLIVEGRDAEVEEATRETEGAIKEALEDTQGDLDQVKEILREKGVKKIEDAPGKFKEYVDRIDQVEAGLAELRRLLKDNKSEEVPAHVNAIIWSISHHPRGFDVPPPVYKWWDWVFGLGIGLGWCVFAIFFGLYLRRSYYRRYKRESI